MAKKIVAPHTKPKEILELEEIIGKEILGIPKQDLESTEVWTIGRYYVYDDRITGLKLNKCNLADLDFLKKFTALESLDLRENQIADISIISTLKKLTNLDISHNIFTDIEPLLKLKNLESLYMHGPAIKNIQLVTQIKSLKGLTISFIPLANIDFVNELPNIKHLFLTNCSVTNIEQLVVKNMDVLFLYSNNIKCIPKNIAQHFEWFDRNGDPSKLCLLQYNPLEFPPTSVINLEGEVVQNYYQDAEQYGDTALSEGRIIFIGDGSAGKSSIIEKTLYNNFTLGKVQTNGIKIEHFSLTHPEDGRKLNFHIWDFGGQEIQHAVHKFFFSEGCLYVLVLDNRKEEDPEYWLQQIESLGGNAPVLVVFNKQDQNNTETADRKYLKEKYPNIVGFFNTSCANDMGMADFKKALETQAVQLRTVSERFPNNWLEIKKAIELHTSGNQHYLTFETYQELCKQHHIPNEKAQKLLLQYLNTIGAVTWFGEDVHLNMLHVLKPEWITQGVYKIITAQKTARLFGQIQVSDFKELLQPLQPDDYTYANKHYGFILSMMIKFNLCYTTNHKDLLIPSAFGKMPKVEYSDFKGAGVRTYFLQFKQYMPLALIHRFITRSLHDAVDKNYWYTGIVLQDVKSTAQAMVHADKDAKRIYIRIKNGQPLGIWEHIRRVLAEIADDYAKIPYDEMILLEEKTDSAVKYSDIVAYLKAGKYEYFHPTLGRDFKTKELLSYFEDKATTIEKIETNEIVLDDINGLERRSKTVPQFVLNILNDVKTEVNTQVNVDIDINIVNEISSELQGELNYLLGIVDEQNKVLVATLQDLVKFTDDAKNANSSSDLVGKGWKRKLKQLIPTLAQNADTIKKLNDGAEVLGTVYKSLKELAKHVKLEDIDSVLGQLQS